ncbi:hypothetical protein I6N96_01090 [Enterococcus sp. BWM-S5]|uniref:Uncharacterized protein n=1 Tax=Enterococcus larvae TaxID=2794352 RepID=A0ABS4CFY6_9ENTE|nr:hypothetical protein [Enterococcus larvae]MBP1044857.1 hypothetical protein [Enterococcus larvae]
MPKKCVPPGPDRPQPRPDTQEKMIEQPRLVNEYLHLLEQAQDVMENQKEAIKAAIGLRLYNQQILEILKLINTTGNLSEYIQGLEDQIKVFDNLVVEYGPYDPTTYTMAVKNNTGLITKRPEE